MKCQQQTVRATRSNRARNVPGPRLLAGSLVAAAALCAVANAQVPGDFNGDGYGDLAIGVPRATVDGLDDAGEILIIYGSSAGLNPAIVQTLNQDSGGVGASPNASDQFGAALATGHFDDDEYADLIVGVPFEGIGGGSDAAAFHVFYGTPLGLSSTGSEMMWESKLGHTSEDGDHFGSELATGDVNGDGYDDVVVGQPDEDVGARSPSSTSTTTSTPISRLALTARGTSVRCP